MKHQIQEVMALKLRREEAREHEVPYYCAAPNSGGAFDIDEPSVGKGWMSVSPSSEWLEAFGMKRHIPY